MRSWKTNLAICFIGLLMAYPAWSQEYGRSIVVDGVNDFDDPETEDVDEYLLAIDDGHDPATEELAPIWSDWNNGIGDAAIEDNWNHWIGPNDDYSANPMEMGKIYVTNDRLYLYIGLVHTDTDDLPLPGGFGYWSSQIGTAIDVNRTPSGGNQSQASPRGYTDPWSNNEEFFHEHRPDFVAWFDHRSNEFKLYHWNLGNEWWNEITQDSLDSYYPEFPADSFTIYGDDGIPNRLFGPFSGPHKFLELQIPLRAIGIDYDSIYAGEEQDEPPVISLEAWCTQSGRGAYDTVPTDNQIGHYPSMGDWSTGDDKTDLSHYADYFLAISTGVVPQDKVDGTKPKQFILLPNYPNPFNAKTVIGYRLMPMEPTPVSLRVYNLRGQRVRTLVSTIQSSGEYQVTWDGRSDAGNPLASGVYFLNLEVGGKGQTKKLVLTR